VNHMNHSKRKTVSRKQRCIKNTHTRE
jgi:hypothetical protein